jgi:hypothetical protein
MERRRQADAQGHAVRADPQREVLGDLDVDEWPAGLDGKPADPWRDGRHVHLVQIAIAKNEFDNNRSVAVESPA